jgi:SM-20-related protein
VAIPNADEWVNGLSAAADALERDGWALIDGFLDPRLINALAESARNGPLTAAQVGRGAHRQAAQDIRRDTIAWIEPEQASAAECAYFSTMDTLRSALNARLWLNLHALEAHYAHYPPGAFYRRHRDRFRDDDRRMLSSVLYLNAHWPDDAGGDLLLHLPDGVQRVSPQANRLALFLSADIEHEVEPTIRDRYSIAGWFMRQ